MKFKIGDKVKIINKNIYEIIESFKHDENAYPRLANYSTTRSGVIVDSREGIEGMIEPIYALDIDEGFLAWVESDLVRL